MEIFLVCSRKSCGLFKCKNLLCDDVFNVVIYVSVLGGVVVVVILIIIVVCIIWKKKIGGYDDIYFDVIYEIIIFNKLIFDCIDYNIVLNCYMFMLSVMFEESVNINVS